MPSARQVVAAARAGAHLVVLPELAEAADDDVFNASVLVGPQGEVAGRVRKRHAESYVFRAGHGAGVIDTALGGGAVGIGADAHLTAGLRRLGDQQVDLVVLLGLFGGLLARSGFALRGRSRVVDSDGTTLAQLHSEDGVAAGTVTVDSARRRFAPPADYDGWLPPGSRLLRRVLIPVDSAAGRLSYRWHVSDRRRPQDERMTADAPADEGRHR
jgi:predicted amidohydrolase